jgi:outer membrane immunogenic protein
MKKLALHVTAISLMLAGAASAADLRRPMPVKAPAPAPVVAYNWTGCYVGAGGGYGMFDQESRFVDPPFVTLHNDNGGRGWFGTVQVGCDYQVGGPFALVIGAFADYDFSGIKGDMTFPGESLVGEEKLKHYWAAGGRIGWLPFERLMVFVSGGYTEAKFGAVNFTTFGGFPTGVSLPKHTYSGWFVGTGYEYGLSFLPGLFWKTEYRFADYGKDRVQVLEGGDPTGVFIESRKYVHTVRSELVWRFNFGGGPVVARY